VWVENIPNQLFVGSKYFMTNLDKLNKNSANSLTIMAGEETCFADSMNLCSDVV
jgi:hypothetical protein